MRFFIHSVLHSLFVSLQDKLVWHTTFPDGRRSYFSCLHMYVRASADQGHPEQECVQIAIFESMLGCLEEVEQQVAQCADPHLVELATRLQVDPMHSELQKLLPRGSLLYLVDCGWTQDGQHFDMYLVSGPDRKLVYLNPILAAAHLFPTSVLNGNTRILVPFAGNELHGGTLLAQALATRLWGENEAERAYPFEMIAKR